MSRPRSIYVSYMLSIFHFQPHFYCDYQQTHLFFVCFLEYLLLFLDDSLDEESE